MHIVLYVLQNSCEHQRVMLKLNLIIIGTSSEDDVAGIDINMGCPKWFSLNSGMGASLMCKPEKSKSILTTLVQNVRIPITCKIRVFPSTEETLNLVKELASTGIAAIAIHGRTKTERPHNPNRNEMIAEIARNIDIPVIAK